MTEKVSKPVSKKKKKKTGHCTQFTEVTVTLK